MGELLTVKEAAEKLKVHENTVYLWLETGKLKGIRFGGLWRIPEESLKEPPV